MRRRLDGTFEEIDWEVAIAEIAGRLKAVKEAAGPDVGGKAIFYYGGGGQGNHLGGGYGNALLRADGSAPAPWPRRRPGSSGSTTRCWARWYGPTSSMPRWPSSWGKNPWQSHGIPHARTTLKEIARDPNRSLIVIDPRRTETADLADFHLRVRPGTDAWLLAALAAVVVQEDLVESALAGRARHRRRGHAGGTGGGAGGRLLRPQRRRGNAGAERRPADRRSDRRRGGLRGPRRASFVLSAGERRSFTANTIMRDPSWRKRDPSGALRVSPGDAFRLGLADGGRARLSTRRGAGTVTVEVDDRMQDAHISLPNGLGLTSPSDNGEAVVTGLAPNELTAAGDRDPYAGTPWHKHVPARLEPVEEPAA